MLTVAEGLAQAFSILIDTVDAVGTDASNDAAGLLLLGVVVAKHIDRLKYKVTAMKVTMFLSIILLP
ncbi:MAG: hypothetical protein DMENIID0002_11460 [Rickettsia endosymbiont of Sergentomyia squamirostris]|uniref:Uncharacterized protein n=1 Tax=Candidatus Tisiphia endosymbiont of Sergentomyia squamirostris TaxID=3113639 RepID=A0AAT9G9R5_9RICK